MRTLWIVLHNSLSSVNGISRLFWGGLLVMAVGAACTQGSETSAISAPSAIGTAAQELVLGHCSGDDYYLEIPFKDSYQLAGETAETTWKRFFKSALRPGWSVLDTNSVYWAFPVAKQWINEEFIRENTAYQVGDMIPARTLDRFGAIRLSGYSIECSDIGEGCLLLAQAKSANDASPLPCDLRLIVAGRKLPSCKDNCGTSTPETRAEVLESIATRVIQTAQLRYEQGIPERFRGRAIKVFKGRFTSNDQDQFVAYVNLHPVDAAAEGDAATVIVDSRFDIKSSISSHESLHLIPFGVADIDQDGLDEVWISLSTIESESHGVLFLKRTGPPAEFIWLSTH